MKLHWGPHTCAIGIHILLEETGRAYETEKIDVGGGATEEAWFKAINQKGKAPTLIADDGRVLTEFGAIAVWLARQAPALGLMPTDPDEEQRALSLTDYVTGTIHGQAYGRIFMPARFEPQDPVHQTIGLGQASVKKQGETMLSEAFAILADQLAGRDLQAEIRAEQPAWASLVELPKPPTDAAPIARPLDAYTGIYESPLYGTLAVTRAGDRLAATIGGRPARLTPWSGDTFLMSFPNPDIAPGLMTFAVAGSTATSIDGAAIPRTLTVSYGRFERVR